MANRGRPKTGRSTKVVRIPIDMDIEIAISMYYEIHPKLQAIATECKLHSTSPRWQMLTRMLDDLGY